jgi:serine/threonine-protein kinase
MVMEFVSGKTLVDLIPKGGLRPPQALKYGVQMADALSVAHAAGIVHRDIKPGNVMVTDSGLVKVLDFGLAKLTDRGPVSQMGDNTQTIADAPLTVEGSIIGTVSYMSPEQAQGKKVDTRSDIFSFGVVFYEMLTGSRAFSGDSALSTLSAILRDEHKPMIEIAPDVPPQLELLISRCLRKNPDDRWQSMKDVLAALGALKHESDSGQLYRSRIQAMEMSSRAAAAVAAKKSSAPMVAGLAGLALLLVGGGGGAWWWMKHHTVAAPPPPIVVEVPVPAAPLPVPAPVEAPPAEPTLNNDSIIEMVKEKVPTSEILNLIRSSNKTDFVLTKDELIRLTKAGVSGALIAAMRDPKHIPAQPAEASKDNKKTQATASTKPTVTEAPLPPVGIAGPLPPTTAKVTTAPPPVSPAPAPAKPAVVAVPVTIADGVPFSIKLAEDVPTDAEEGRVLHFTAVDGLKVGENVVVAKGASVTGSVVDAAGKKKNVFGMGGKMTFRLVQADAVDGKKLNVRTEPSKGKDGPAKRPIDSGAKGKTKEIAAAAGSQYIAYIEGEQTVSVHK